MNVALVGSGPTTEAVRAALADADATVEAVDVEDLGRDHRLAVVVDQAGAPTFERASERALADGIPWLAVELGGIGGYPVVDAAVAGFDPDGACYDCLEARVGANVDPEADPHAAPADATARYAGAIAGRRAVQFLAPDPARVMETVVEVPHAERDLLPVPNCRCGGDRDRVLDRNDLQRNVDQALSHAEGGLDRRVGIVHNVGEAESYPAPYYLAEIADTSGFSDVPAPRHAAGVDAGWDAAFMKALGEGLERYCGGVYWTEEFTTARAGDLDAAVPASEFVRPDGWADPSQPAATDGGDEDVADRESESDPESEWEPLTDTSDDQDPNVADDHEQEANLPECEWVLGENLATGERVHLPAETVHYPPPSERIRPSVTTGLGLGNSTVEALLSGLYEVIERDAMTLAWYSTFEPLGLQVADETFQRLASRAGAHGLSVTTLLVTQDVDVPVVVAAVHREEWPRFAVGTSAGLDPASAAGNALAEAVQNWLELDGMGREGVADADGAIGRYADMPAEAAAFLDVDQTVPADSVGPATVPEGRAHLDAVVDRVTEAGLTPYAARTTTRDVQKLGFEGVRVVVPTAQPLFFDDPYFGERASQVPESLGFEPALEREHHPYP
jgi:ribosomal protein S12 methylthiotransferase accessory factor